MGTLTQFVKSNNRFHKETDGSAMIFVVIVLFVLVSFFVFTIHVGQRFTNKVEMQNAADASVLSGAVWQARGLNTISILNVGMTECLALIIMFKAWDSTLDTANLIYDIDLIIARILKAIPYTKAIGEAWEECLEEYMRKMLDFYEEINDQMKPMYEEPDEILWKLMSGIRKVEDGVSYATPVVAIIQASEIAKNNGADEIEMVDGIQGNALFWWPNMVTGDLKLPVTDGNFVEDLCSHTWEGGQGYKHYLCWDSAMDMEIGGIGVRDTLKGLWSALICLIPNPGPIYSHYIKSHYHSLCPESSSQGTTETINMRTNNCDTCEENKGKSKWAVEKIIEVSENRCDESLKVEGSYVRNAEERRSLENGELPGEPMQNGNDPGSSEQGCRRCELFTQDGRYYNKIWEMEYCDYDMEAEIPEEDTSDRPLPLILEGDWQNKVKYNSLVYKHEDTKFTLLNEHKEPIHSMRSPWRQENITYGKNGNSRIGGTVDIHPEAWSLARAVVYNASLPENPDESPTPENADWDLFNQNWHAKLAPIDVDGLKPTDTNIPLPSMLTQILNESAEAIEEVLVH